jgi:hypothetical protein
MYYVYAILDYSKPCCRTINVDGEIYAFTYQPVYIGKGKSNRMNVHTQPRVLDNDPNKEKVKFLRNCLLLQQTPLIIKLVVSESEIDALDIEAKLILALGRKDLKNGYLLNRTYGKESLLSEESRLQKQVKMSKHSITAYDLYGQIVFANLLTYEICKKYDITRDTLYILFREKHFSPTYKVFFFESSVNTETVKAIINTPKFQKYRKRSWGSLYDVYDKGVLVYIQQTNKELVSKFGKLDFSSYSQKNRKIDGYYTVQKTTIHRHNSKLQTRN